MDVKNRNKMKKNCLNCRHYYITWDRSFPRGCRALAFKTRFSPSAAVYNASGLPCLYFQEKRKPGR